MIESWKQADALNIHLCMGQYGPLKTHQSIDQIWVSSQRASLDEKNSSDIVSNIIQTKSSKTQREDPPTSSPIPPIFKGTICRQVSGPARKFRLDSTAVVVPESGVSSGSWQEKHIGNPAYPPFITNTPCDSVVKISGSSDFYYTCLLTCYPKNYSANTIQNMCLHVFKCR